MENSKYLNEERYSAVKKKLIKAAILVLIIGIAIGIALIITGIITKVATKNSYRSTTEIQADIDSAKAEETSLNISKNQEFFEHGLSAKYYELASQIEKKRNQITNLETELYNAQNTSSIRANGKSYPFYIFGAFIIVASGMASGFLFLFANKYKYAIKKLTSSTKKYDILKLTINKEG